MSVLFTCFIVALMNMPQPAGAAPEHVFSDETLLDNWRHDVYVVSVKSVNDANATNEHPPHAIVVIKEALRGDRRVGSEMDSEWAAFPHDIDTGGREKELEAWNRTPLAGPTVGETYIVLQYYAYDGELFRISPRCRYPYSKEKRDWVASLMGDWKRLRKEEADRLAALKKAADDALEADRRLQSKADIPALVGQSTDVAEGTCRQCSPDAQHGGWVLSVSDVRSIKRPDVRLDQDGSRVISVWTDQDLSAVVPVRGSRNKVVIFLQPLPEKWYRNGYRLAGGALGVLEATPDRLARIEELR